MISEPGSKIASFDQLSWAEALRYQDLDPLGSLRLFAQLRSANLSLYRSLTAEKWQSHGIHAERGRETVASLVKLLAGHDLNHIAQLRRTLEAAAATSYTSKWHDAALIVIDVQKGFDAPRLGKRNNPEAESNIAALLNHWRAAGRPVKHIQHDSVLATGLFPPGTVANEVKAEAKPLPDEPVYRKNVNSAFIGTALEEDLRKEHIERLVIVGLTTNHCVSTTARMGGNLGFDVAVVSDATAAFEQLGYHGRSRSPIEVHEAALSDLNHEFATIIRCSDLLPAAARVGADCR